MPVEAVLFDVNETLFTLDPVRDRFDEVGLGRELVPLWFARVLRDGFAAATSEGFVSFPDLARHHLLALDGDVDADHVITGFEEVTPHDDVADTLRALQSAGVAVATFTNGTSAITRSFLERAGLEELVDHVLDVGGPRRWKPHPEAYSWACREVRASPEGTALVAVHPWDVLGAMSSGLTGVWVDREDTVWPSFWGAPDHRVPSLTSLEQLLHL